MPEPILTPAHMRALRADVGLTQGEMAAALHYSVWQYARWERGKTMMPAPLCDRFLDVVEKMSDIQSQRRARRDRALARLPHAC